MTLSELLQDVEVIGEFTDVEIKDVTDSTQRMVPGCAFVCIRGERTDGNTFAQTALDAGAACIVTETDLGLPNQVLVKNSREAYALMCGAYFGNPAQILRLIGVTGTNGKTTTTYLLKEILENAGYTVGLIGTIEDIVGKRTFDASRTTPDPYELHKLFRHMADAGCQYCVMEVSSQALAQGRVIGCWFDTAVFTNLTRDHLDYHKTMDNYLSAKKILFSQCDTGVVNIDDKYARYIIAGSGCQVVSFSINNLSHYRARDILLRSDGTEYRLEAKGKEFSVKLPILGEFSVLNSLGAIAAASECGIAMPCILDALANSKGVRGRLEFVPTGRDFSVIIDYAHTPDGLENVLCALNQLKKGRIITVFGCGGDRDKTKRPIMGEIAAKLSDYCVITSDNPRTENPMQIIRDILPAFADVPEQTYQVVENRREAIGTALALAGEDDIVLLAGKGHECYQILNDGVIHFDEREIVADFLNNKTQEPTQ